MSPRTTALILLDPFADFLLNEFGYRRETPTGHFDSIVQATDRTPKALRHAIRAACRRNSHRGRLRRKMEEIQDYSFSMRRPKIIGTEVDGEAGYDIEILLTSKRFAENDHQVVALKDNLAELARTLEKVLRLKSGELVFRHPD